MPAGRFYKSASKANYKKSKTAPKTKAAVKKIVKATEEFKRSTTIVRNAFQGAFPDRMIVKLKNAFPVEVAGATSSGYAFVADGNNLLTPLTAGPTALTGAVALSAGTATSIAGLPVLLALASAKNGIYNSYRIHSCSITAYNEVVSAEGAIHFHIFPFCTNAFGGFGLVNTFNTNNIREQPYCKYQAISDQSGPKKLRHHMSTAKMYGLQYKASLEDPAYAGAKGQKPASVWSWVLYWQNLDTGTVAKTDCQVNIVYEIEFFNRNVVLTGSDG